MKEYKGLIIASIIAIPIIIILLWVVGVKNRAIGLENDFKQKGTERVAFFDKMFKKISGVAKVALRNDSSFQQVVIAQMNGQKDAEQVTWKWVQQSNPAATFGQVTLIYQELARAVEAEREGFFQEEKMLQDIKLQHDNLRKKWPSSMVVGGRKELPYTPITSDRTDEVFKTGKDNNTDPFK